jgi:WD40 repeat protein
VDGVAFSPDGKSVAITSSSFGDTLQLFDIDSGIARWKHWGQGAGFLEASFSADGSLLCVANSVLKATILDAGDGHVVMRRRIRGAVESAGGAVISPAGTRLTTVGNRNVRVYDVRSGAERLRFRLTAYSGCLRYSPDGTRIATFAKDGIHVWDAASGQLQDTLHVPAKTNQMQFGGCSHVLVTAGSDDSIIRAWDVASGTLTALCDTAPGTKWLTLGDGSGRVALTGCTDGTLRVWDVTTGLERTRLPTPKGCRVSVVNSDATKLAICNRTRSVEIWSLVGGAQQQPAPDAAAPDYWCPRCTAG